MTRDKKSKLLLFSLSNLITLIAIIWWSAGSVGPAIAAPVAEGNDDDLIIAKVEKDTSADIPHSSLDELQNLLTRHPQNYKAHMLMGTLLDRLGLDDQAQDEYSLAVKYGPNDPKAVVELVKAKFKAGQVDAAWKILNEANRKFQNDPEILYWVGNYMFTSKEVQNAEALFVVALASKKKVFGLHTALAAIRVKTRPGEALRFAEIDLAEKPNYDLALRVKGFALMQLKQYDQAVEPLKAVYERDWKRPELSENYAECLWWLGRYEEAFEPALQNLASTASPYTNNIESKRLLLKIITHVPKGALLATMEKISTRNDKRGKHSAYYFALGDVLDVINYHELAIAQYRRGLELDPGFARAYFRLGRDLLYLGRNQEALENFKAAYVLRPGDPEIGACYRRMQDRVSMRGEDFAGAWKQWIKSKIRS